MDYPPTNDPRYRALIWAWMKLKSESEQWDDEKINEMTSAFDEEIKNRPMVFPGGASFFQHVLNTLEAREKKYKSGKGRALLNAVETCATMEIPMPDWVSEEFIKAIGRLKSCEVKTLDEAFGTAPKKNQKFTALQRRANYGTRVYVEIRSRAEQGASIGEDLFRSVGEELGLSMSSVRDYYYGLQKQYPPFFLDSIFNSWKESSENLPE